MKKRLINYNISAPSSNQSPIISQSCNRPFYFPSAFIPPQFPPILDLFSSVISMWSYQLYSLFLPFTTQFLRIIRLITNQTLRLFAHFFYRFIGQFYFMWRGRVHGHPQRNTFAVRHHHKASNPCHAWFCRFRHPPFLAGIKLPSIKHSLQSIWDFLSSLFYETTPDL